MRTTRTASDKSRAWHRGIFWSARACCLLCAIIACAGCGQQDHPRCYPVRGQVVVGEQPLAEATVVLHPLTEARANTPKPIGRTDEEGRFVISTLAEHDGAPEGEYAVTIEFRKNRTVGEEVIRDGAQLMPPRYSDPKQTILRYEVVAGENVIPPFQLEEK